MSRKNIIFFKKMLDEVDKNYLLTDKATERLEENFYTYYWDSSVWDNDDVKNLIKIELQNKKGSFIQTQAYLWDKSSYAEYKFNLTIKIEK